MDVNYKALLLIILNIDQMLTVFRYYVKSLSNVLAFSYMKQKCSKSDGSLFFSCN